MKTLLFFLFATISSPLLAQYHAEVSVFPKKDSLYANEPIRATYCLFVAKKDISEEERQEKIHFEFLENGYFRRTAFSSRFLGRKATSDSFCYAYILTPMRQGECNLPTGRFVRGHQLLAAVETPMWVRDVPLSKNDSMAYLEARRGDLRPFNRQIPPKVTSSQPLLPLSLEISQASYQAQVGERVTLRYILNRSSEDWIFPTHPAFRTIAITKGYSIRLSQGQSEYIAKRNLHLIPQEVSSFEFPPYQVVIEGDTITSPAVRIIVNN